MSEETLPVLASSAPEQSSLPLEEKRRRLAELVVNSVPSPTSQRVYRALCRDTCVELTHPT
jgi:hypothetical protein